jgi:hypothetical protein
MNFTGGRSFPVASKKGKREDTNGAGFYQHGQVVRARHQLLATATAKQLCAHTLRSSAKAVAAVGELASRLLPPLL